MIRHYGVDKTIEITQQCILIELNKIRSENWLPPLELDLNLMKWAQKYAEYMHENKWYNHVAKNWDNWEKRAKKAWYKWKYVRENIWFNFICIENAITGRKNSKGHFQTIIDPNLHFLWVGFDEKYWDTLFWWE
jgi:uncharacterized protein YkwD